jgi:hypothetical protein
MERQVQQSFSFLLYSALAKRWSSDLEYFTIESRFLHRLFEDYQMTFYSPAFNGQLKELERRLSELEKQGQSYAVKVAAQLARLEKINSSRQNQDRILIEKEHLEFEQQLMDFIERFRELKKELFEFVEQAESAHERFDSCK